MSLSSIGSTNIAADALFSALSSRQTRMTALAQTALSTGADRAMQGDYEGAVREFRRAIGLDPSPEHAVRASNLLATSYIQMGRTEDAIQAYKSSISMAPTDDTAHLRLGNIYFSQGRYHDAEAEYKIAVRNNPVSATNLFSLGQAYLATDRSRLAETLFKKVIRMDPGQYGGYYALGQTYNKEGRQREAVSEFQKVISLKKDFYEAHVDLGYAYADLGEMSKAEEELSLLNDKAPDLATLLGAYMDKTTKPKILAAYNVSGFTVSSGPGTAVSALNSSLSTPGASRQFNMVFLFTKEMDASSVQNPYNWSVTKAAYGSAGGAYNWGLPTPPTDVAISPVPVSVVFLPGSLSATVSFMVTQNAGADGTIDPSHIKFKFWGRDIYGNAMDASADEYSGISKIV